MLTQSLIDKFNNYFVIELVTNDKQREDMYRLRYDVYIKEFKFDDADKFPDSLEKDEFDDISTACVIYHVESGKPAACVRVIPGSKCEQFPVEKYIGHTINQDILNDLNKNRSNLAEISRLAVSRNFRRRSKESITAMGYVNGDEERTYPLLSVACFLTCIILSDIENTENHIASMEPFLPRLLQRQNLNFKKIGDLTFYHGQRCSYLIHKTDVLNNLSEECRNFTKQIHQELFSQLLTVF